MPADFINNIYLPKAPAIDVLCCNFALLNKWEFADLGAPYWHWYWVDRPGAAIGFEEKYLNLDPGKIVLVPPNVHFSASSCAVFGQLYIHFLLKTEFRQPLPGPIILPLSKEQIQFVRCFSGQILNQENHGISPLLMPPLALISLALSQTDEECWIQPNNDVRIARAIRQMESDYPVAVPNSTLSRLAGMNMNAFIRLFKQVTNQTPRQYLQELRVIDAAALLHHSNLSVDEIAEKTGFNDRPHFNLMFRKQTGSSPAQFRKNSFKV